MIIGIGLMSRYTDRTDRTCGHLLAELGRVLIPPATITTFARTEPTPDPCLPTRQSVIPVTLEESNASASCPYCHDALASSILVVCLACVTRFHPRCWNENGKRCSRFGCTTTREP